MHDKHAPARLATLEPRLPAGGMVGQKKDDLLTQTELTQREENPNPQDLGISLGGVDLIQLSAF